MTIFLLGWPVCCEGFPCIPTEATCVYMWGGQYT